MRNRIFTYSILIIAISFVAIGFTYFISSPSIEEQQHQSITTENISVRDLVSSKTVSERFEKHNIFKQGDNSVSNLTNKYVENALTLRIDREKLSQLYSAQPVNLEFEFPGYRNQNIVLQLTKVNLFSKGFRLTSKTSAGETVQQFTPNGIYYQGLIKGQGKSLASLSVFEDNIVAIISDDVSNYELGRIKDKNNHYSDDYIFYADNNLKVSTTFNCDVDKHESKLLHEFKQAKINIEKLRGSLGGRDSVKIYYECDNAMWQDNNSNYNDLLAKITSMHNAIQTIYSIEQIPFLISQISYWPSLDPYSSYNDSYSILLRFAGTTKDNFFGDIAHLLSTRSAGLGGIANIRTLCQPFNAQDSSGRYCYSNIDGGAIIPYPTYSWTVMVTTHEMGHVLGSRHTHACVWPKFGNPSQITAIDTCIVTAENSSFSGFGGCVPVNPSNSCFRPSFGQIMSYCHFCFNNGGGILLTNGFGTGSYKPSGDTIRLRYAQATCMNGVLNSSELPSTFDLMQNYPNPFNPATTIRFAMVESGFVTLKIYDLLGREVGVLVKEQFYDKGFFTYVLNANTFNLSSGVYFYKLDVSSTDKNVYSNIRKMVLVK